MFAHDLVLVLTWNSFFFYSNCWYALHVISELPIFCHHRVLNLSPLAPWEFYMTNKPTRPTTVPHGSGYFIFKMISQSAKSPKNVPNVRAPKITQCQNNLSSETLKVRKPFIIGLSAFAFTFGAERGKY